MPAEHAHATYELLMVFVLSAVSAIIGIGHRLISGQSLSWIWFITEFLTAILCGYLMYTAYPEIVEYLPTWVTEPLAIAVAAHSGGRIFKASESYAINWLEKFFIKTL